MALTDRVEINIAYPLTRHSKWSVREHRFQLNACASSKDSFWLQYMQNTVLQEGRLLEASYSAT